MNRNAFNKQNQIMNFYNPNNGYNIIMNYNKIRNNRNDNINKMSNYMNNSMNNMNYNMNNINNEFNVQNNIFDDLNNSYMNTFNNNFVNNNFNNMNFYDNYNINNNKNNQLEINQNVINIMFVLWTGGRMAIQTFPEEKVSDLIKKFIREANNRFWSINFNRIKFEFEGKLLFENGKILNEALTVRGAGLYYQSPIYVEPTGCVTGGGIGKRERYDIEINIKFIKLPQKIIYYNENPEIQGLLKLCFLKEVSQKISDDNLRKLPELIQCILKILSNGYLEDNPDDLKKNIVDVLKKMRGSNIINFSNYVDEVIDDNQINKILNLLSKSDLKEMKDIKNRLSKYNNSIKLFNNEFEKSKKESIFEFSIISLVVIEREYFEKFEIERKKCPNRVDKILYHGTSIELTSNILTGLYRKSMEKRKAINGKGVYFTDLLDYAWYYGGEGGNRENFHSIPKVDDTFTVIVNSIYYSRYGFQQVTDGNRTPGKNQINFAYAGAGSERLTYPDTNKFLAKEYIIYDLDQICPFMSAKFKRVEYCVIWRDNNFSNNPVYNNEFDQVFKSFLKERMKYINQNAKFNIYPCETSEEALELVNRKKYNKIILISNVGADKGGKKFIEKARQIIGNDVIALFLAYQISHLDWIKNFKNAIFSNDPKFYEEYLRCFEGEEGEYYIKLELKNLIGKMETHYGVKFNFDDNYLNYPKFKSIGKYSELEF